MCNLLHTNRHIYSSRFNLWVYGLDTTTASAAADTLSIANNTDIVSKEHRQLERVQCDEGSQTNGEKGRERETT